MIYILHEPGADSIYKRQDGQPVAPDARGVYWHGEGSAWTAMKPYRNVVLSWTGEEQALDERFERLDTVLSQLGKPAEQVRAALPAEDQPCGEQPTGTCRDENGATVTTVERSERLKLPNLQVKVYKVQTGRFVVPPRRYGLIRRAKGRFVLAAMRIKNTGNESLRGLYDVKLKIGDKLYDQHSAATWTVTPIDAFPRPARRLRGRRAGLRPARERRARGAERRRARVPGRRRPRLRRGRGAARPDPARPAGRGERAGHRRREGLKPGRRRDAAGTTGTDAGERERRGTDAPPPQRSLTSRRTRPPPAPSSVAGPLGAAMPSTRIAFSPRPSFSRPSVEATSRLVRSRTRSSR